MYISALISMAKANDWYWSFENSGSDCAFCEQPLNSNALFARENTKVFHYHCALLNGIKNIDLLMPEA
jgi:hypothetical protein